MTQDFNFTSRSPNNQGFTGQNTQSPTGWSGFMNNLNIGGQDGGGSGNGSNRTFSWTITFNTFGRQRFYSAVDDQGGIFINGSAQATMGGFNGQTLITTTNYYAPGTYTLSATVINSGGGPWGVALDWVDAVPPPPPTVTSFSASPNPQNSGAGVPLYSTRLSFNSSGLFITSANIISSAGENFNVASSGSLDITNLAQSNANGTSPTQRTYSFRACNPGGCSPYSSIPVNARNDNTPSNSWTTSFINLEPSTLVTLTLGNLAGVDMPTTISTSGSGNFVGNGGSFSGTRNFTNGQTVQLRTTTLPFNTDVSGLTGTFGNTNTKTVAVTTPSGSFNVTFVTRAPRIKEDFDYTNNLNKYPYEDIDLIVNLPQEFTTSSQIPIDDIEINQEIKVSDPDAQVSINNGAWQNVREI